MTATRSVVPELVPFLLPTRESSTLILLRLLGTDGHKYVFYQGVLMTYLFIYSSKA